MSKERTKLPDGRTILPDTREVTYRIMSPTTPAELENLVKKWGQEIGVKIASGDIVGFNYPTVSE